MRYEELHNSLENDLHKKNDNYPQIVNDAYILLETFKGHNKLINKVPGVIPTKIRGPSFNQEGKSEQQQ